MKKKDFIEFLVEECYSNFPELVEKFSKEGLYKLLNRNIRQIKYLDRTSYLYNASYSPVKRIIEFYGIDEISFEDLNQNTSNLKEILSHEGIHALFKNGVHSTGCKNVVRGFNIKGFVKDEIIKRFKSRKTVLEKIKVLANMPKYYISLYEQGRGLNEGFTEWVSLQCVKCSSAYYNEVGIIIQLEQFRDKKDILKIGDGDTEEIAKLFNMNFADFDLFLTQVDEMHLNEVNIAKNKIIKTLKEKKDKGENIDLNLLDESDIDILTDYGLIENGIIQLDIIDDVYKRIIEPQIKSHKIVSTEIQRKLLQNVILPELEDLENNKEKLRKLFEIHYLVEGFMEYCDIEKEDIPEFEELDEIYKVNIKKHDQEFFEKLREMKNSSKVINLCELDDMLYIHEYAESVPVFLKKTFEMLLEREIEDDEIPKIKKEFKDLVFSRREKNEECQFWNSDKFIIVPTERIIKKKQSSGNLINEMNNQELQKKSKIAKKDSLFKRLIKRIVMNMGITLEEVNNCERANNNELENNKGDEKIEEHQE